MAAGRRKRRGGGGHEGPDERWLLTYADMITLLMALFIVMFAISNVNKAKLEALSTSLKESVPGAVVDGGQSVLQNGGNPQGQASPKVQPPVPAIQPMIKSEFEKQYRKKGGAEGNEEDQFEKVKRDLDAYARKEGLKHKLETEITRRGLVIRMLTDGVLFDSGQAKIKPRSVPVIEKIAGVLQVDEEHPINVEGHTDNVPIHSSQYPTNWELSTARAASVVRLLISENAPADRLGAVGYAQLHPLEPNTTDKGRSRNRRVEIVLLRVTGNSSR